MSVVRIGGWKNPGLLRDRSLLFALPPQFLSQLTAPKQGRAALPTCMKQPRRRLGRGNPRIRITWGTSPREDRRFNEVDVRNEIEFGVTEHFQIGLYLADWGYREDPAAHEHGFSYQTSAVELIYNLTNPTTDLLGLALYGEVRGGPEELELESKVILQKNLGRFVVAYNGTLEAKWEGDRLEEKVENSPSRLV